jgi:lysophospholipase L1-like esterase
MNKIFLLIKRYPLVLAGALLLCTTITCWYLFGLYKDTNIFYVSVVVYLLCVFLLVIGAAKYQDFKIRTAILLSAASLLLVLAMSDFYLLTFSYDTSGPGGENVITHRRWYNKFVHNNEYGFWERPLASFENPGKRKNEVVIAVVGDSFVWAQGVKGKNHRLTEQLEKLLNAVPGGKKVTVLNFGKGGADTLQEMQVINEFVSRVHPDIVLLGYLSNDIDSDSFITYSADYTHTGEKLSTLSPTLNLIYWRLIGPAKYRHIGLKYMQGLVARYNDPGTFQKHMDNLQNLFKDVEEMGAQPIFVLMPFPHMWKMFPKETRDDIYSRLKRAVAEAGVPIIDLSYMEGKYSLEEFQVNPFDGHPNEKMNEEFAATIYRWLENHAKFADMLKKKNNAE